MSSPGAGALVSASSSSSSSHTNSQSTASFSLEGRNKETSTSGNKRPRWVLHDGVGRSTMAEEEREFYKSKLVQLARSHATLLKLMEQKDPPRIAQNPEVVSGAKRGDGREKTNVRTDDDDDDAAAALISHSQLSQLTTTHPMEEAEEEDDEEDENPGETQNTEALLAEAATTLLDGEDDVDSKIGNDDTNADEEPTAAAGPAQENTQSTEVFMQEAAEALLSPSQNDDTSITPLHKWNSIQSTRSAFEDFIAETSDLLGAIPELVDFTQTDKTAANTPAGDDDDETVLVEESQDAVMRFGLLDEENAKELAASLPASSRPTPPPGAVVRVGIGVIVKDPSNHGKVFAGVRKGSHGSDTLALPGGHLEMYESWNDCATREVKEETNLDLDPATLQFGWVSNDIMMSEGKHYVTIFVLARSSSRTRRPETMEPHKCLGWNSYSWEELRTMLREGKPHALFGPLRQLVQEQPQTVLDFVRG